jgi:hypothetical protein
MTLSTALKTGLRAGIVALALGGTALVAAPVQAASPNFGFQLNFGNGGFGGGGIVLHFGDDNYFDYCLTNSQIRSALRNKGYSYVKIVKESNNTNKVWAIGKKYGDWYQLRVDRCTGKVDRVEQIYPDGPDNSFNLTFSF